MLAFILLANTENRLRIVEHHDWVIACILLCICLYSAMILFFRGEPNLKSFFVSEIEDTNNITISWLITTFCFTLSMATLLADYVPFVPRFIQNISVEGYVLNRFGFAFLSVFIFYLLKTAFSYFYYQAIGDVERWEQLPFYATKYYFVVSICFMIFSFAYYYYPIDRLTFFYIFAGFLAIIFVFKLLFYHFHQADFLPRIWYYKFLYICTLQIAPILALWKLLFY